MLAHFTHMLLAVLVFVLLPWAGMSQGFDPGFEKKHDYPLRAFLNKFSINLSSGYGHTFYRHSLQQYSYLRNQDGSFIIPGSTLYPDSAMTAYSNWFSDAVPTRVMIGDSPDSEMHGYKFLSASDTSALLMKAGGSNIPVNLSVYFNLFRLRLGGGVALNFHRARYPEPEHFLSRFPEPGGLNTLMTSYYFLLGYSVYEFYDNAFGIDIRFGRLNMGKGFNREVVEASNFMNIGVTLEKVISEYFRVYLRPAYEVKSFALNLPSASVVNHQANTLLLTLGVSINYPDLPRSPIKNDRIQMRHYISDPMGNKREFRGQPLWRKQDPKIGELYPELIKSKRKRQTQRKNNLNNLFKKKQ